MVHSFLSMSILVFTRIEKNYISTSFRERYEVIKYGWA